MTKCFIVHVFPPSQLIPAALHEEVHRKLRMQLTQRFFFVMVKALMRSYFGGVVVGSDRLVPCVGMCIADQPQERTIMALKHRDALMDCSHCTLPSRLHTRTVTGYQSGNNNECNGHVPSSSDEDEPPITRRHKTLHNNHA